MFTIKYTRSFIRDFKLCKKRGYDMSLLLEVMSILESQGTLPQKYKPHKLSGQYNNRWECHLKSDWLLVWAKYENEMTMLLMRTGTHSDLFE